MLGSALDTEVVHSSAERQHQVVVGERRHLSEPDLVLVQIHRRHLSRMDTGVRLVVEQVTKRMPDGDRREQVGGNLVQERLERVIVVAVNEHNVDIRLAQLARSADPGEPSAENQDART